MSFPSSTDSSAALTGDGGDDGVMCFHCGRTEKEVSLFYFTCPACPGPASETHDEAYEFTWDDNRAGKIASFLDDLRRINPSFTCKIENRHTKKNVCFSPSVLEELTFGEWLSSKYPSIDDFPLTIWNEREPREDVGVGRYTMCEECLTGFGCHFCGRHATVDDYVRSGEGPDQQSSGGTGATGDCEAQSRSHFSQASSASLQRELLKKLQETQRQQKQQQKDVSRLTALVSDLLAQSPKLWPKPCAAPRELGRNSSSSAGPMQEFVKISVVLPDGERTKVWLHKDKTIIENFHHVQIAWEDGSTITYDDALVPSDGVTVREIVGDHHVEDFVLHVQRPLRARPKSSPNVGNSRRRRGCRSLQPQLQ